MSFEIGQKVVCVDDAFSAEISEMVSELPKKGLVYTIREISRGRKSAQPGGRLTMILRLEEIVNAPEDRPGFAPEEPGFRSCRFRPLVEFKASADAEQVNVDVRTAQPLVPIQNPHELTT